MLKLIVIVYTKVNSLCNVCFFVFCLFTCLFYLLCCVCKYEDDDVDVAVHCVLVDLHMYICWNTLSIIKFRSSTGHAINTVNYY